MNKFIIGCFISKESPYKEVYEKYLYPSIQKFNLGYAIQITPNYNKWRRNVAEKPKAVISMLDRTPEYTLVLLDADSEILQYPQLFHDIPEEYDIALHYLNWNKWYGYDNKPPVLELLTGTMFFRNSVKVRKLCKEWHEEAVKSNEWEQKTLQRILPKHDLNIFELPLEYCMLISRPGDKPPLIDISGAVILHHQISRKYKRKLM